MIVINNPKEMQAVAINHKKDGKTVAVVPTMGALHKGHLLLVKRAKELADIVIVTIFVNPTQFGKNEDFGKYPRTLKADCSLAKEYGANYVFAPSADDIYPQNYDTTISCGGITSRLEGAARPGHFDGVTTIVLKLFNITQAEIAIFGQKDAQQSLVISKMCRELNLPITLDIFPIVREDDGLAMSSRNRYLTIKEREDVVYINRALKEAETLYNSGERDVKLIKKMVSNIYNKVNYFTTEYIAITDLECINIDKTITDGALLSVVCRTTDTNTRLLDNIILGNL
jgi:pantoate--beta-alanine ligase